MTDRPEVLASPAYLTLRALRTRRRGSALSKWGATDDTSSRPAMLHQHADVCCWVRNGNVLLSQSLTGFDRWQTRLLHCVERAYRNAHAF